jgi:CheY-like chemotaxis protein
LRQGALFWVELPLREVPLPAAQVVAPVATPPRLGMPASPSEAQSADGRGLRVLVADDVAANRMVARAMLVAAGHRVDAASDGSEALAAVQRETYDVILMDVQMPVMDGLEATRRIRALDGPKSKVPILAVTASALAEQVEACHAAGMDGHVAKPIDRDLLLNAVVRLASGDSLAPSRRPVARDGAPVLIDQAALARLASDLGPTADGVIGEFASELRLVLDILAEADVLANRQRLRHAAHRLLGAARTLGAQRLAQAVENLQATSQAGADASLPLRRVLDVGAATMPELEQVRRSMAPGGAYRSAAGLSTQGAAG